MNALLAKLVPAALGAIPPEGRAALASVVELAQGAAEIGPPSPPPAAVQACRLIAGNEVPWQLVAAGAVVAPGADAADLHALVSAVVARGLVGGALEWTGSRDIAGDLVLSYLVMLTRELDRDGLAVLAGVFGNG